MANQEQVETLQQGAHSWNEWRRKNPDVLIDLHEARLAGAQLASPFDHLSLHGANLENADLSHANLAYANLSGAKLCGANLHFANLDGAELYRADFSGARLTWTNLSRAHFTFTKLDGAVLAYATIADVGFKYCTGLETIRHEGPCSIGIDTIYRSYGQVPNEFLRGVGIPETLIANMKGLLASMEPIQFYSGFISYSHADKEFASRLYDKLQAHGIRCWLDEKQVLPGRDLYDEVDRGIRLWDKILLCCSQASLTSWWVDNEIGTALEKEQQLSKERGTKVHAIIPLNLDGYLFTETWNCGYRAQIRRRLAADFTGWKTDADKFEDEIQRLIRALRADESARELPPDARL